MNIVIYMVYGKQTFNPTILMGYKQGTFEMTTKRVSQVVE